MDRGRDGSFHGDVNAGELFPLVGPSCNDKIYQTREELRRDRGEGKNGIGEMYVEQCAQMLLIRKRERGW